METNIKYHFIFKDLRLLPGTRAPEKHFELVFGSGNNDPAEIWLFKIRTTRSSSRVTLYENAHPNFR